MPNSERSRDLPSWARAFAHVGGWIAKAHAYAFLSFRSAAKAAWEDGLEDWKAILIMSVAMNFVGLTCASVVSIAAQRRVLLPDAKGPFLMLWGTSAIALLAFNYYTLVAGRKWTRFERGFRHLSEAMRFCGGVAAWGSVILAVAAAEWSGTFAWKLPAG